MFGKTSPGVCDLLERLSYKSVVGSIVVNVSYCRPSVLVELHVSVKNFEKLGLRGYVEQVFIFISFENINVTHLMFLLLLSISYRANLK